MGFSGVAQYILKKIKYISDGLDLYPHKRDAAPSYQRPHSLLFPAPYPKYPSHEITGPMKALTKGLSA